MSAFGELGGDGLEECFALISRSDCGADGVASLEEEAGEPEADEAVRPCDEDLVGSRDGGHGGARGEDCWGRRAQRGALVDAGCRIFDIVSAMPGCSVAEY